MQALKDFIEVVTAKRALFAAVSFTSLFSPGFVALYRFKSHEFQTWEAWKILGFCGAIGVPSVVCCSFLFFIDGEGEELKSEKLGQALFVMGAAFSTLLLHLAHVILIFTPHATFRLFVYTILALHLMLLAVAVVVQVPKRIAKMRAKKGEANAITPVI